MTKTFAELGLKDSLQRALADMGLETPTEIQAKAIPLLTKTDSNFFGQAQTGTGKTAAFVLPLLEKLDFKQNSVQAIILAPTRELAQQVENEIKKIGKYTPVRQLCIYGGASYKYQLDSLRNYRPHVVVGTPGRVIDLVNRKALKLDESKFCILDEADEMLNMGFYEDVQTILDSVNTECQLVMFSATMPRQIAQLVQRSFGDYEQVKAESKVLINQNIEQKYFVTKRKYFAEALSRLIESEEDIYSIVFCKTKIETKIVGDRLKERGLKVEILNGDMGQNEREHAMNTFKAKKAHILVCTDVAARGIDVTHLTHVFNYGVPQGRESYVHRIGRTGRAGSKGKAYTLITPQETYAIRKLKDFTKADIAYSKLPEVNSLKKNLIGREIESARPLLEALSEKDKEFKIDSTFEYFQEQLNELDKDQLLKLMFSWKFNKEFRRYSDLSDLDASAGSDRPLNVKRGGGRTRGGRGGGGGQRRFSNSRGGGGERSSRREDGGGRRGPRKEGSFSKRRGQSDGGSRKKSF